MSGQFHAPAALPTALMEWGGGNGPESCAGPFGEEKNASPNRGIDPPIVQRVV